MKLAALMCAITLLLLSPALAPALAGDETDAMIMALSAPNWLEPGESYAVTGEVGQAGNAQALALGAMARVDKHSSVNAAVGLGLDSDRVQSRAGFRYGW